MQHRRLAAIMFTDVVGFTSMMAKDEPKTLKILERIRYELKPLIKKYNGKFQKELGDGTLSSFSSAVEAVNCALDFQIAIGAEEFKIRVGIHVGEVIITEEDIFGDGVNIASRIESLAPPGGIYISERVFEDISNKPEINAVFVGARNLKNVNRTIKIYALTGEGLPDPPNQRLTNNNGNNIKNLLSRRIPQTVFLYLLFSFIIVQLVHWILNKYMLSPNWLNFSWILLLSLLPSIVLLSYNHGNPGKDKWIRTKKIFIPVNIVAAGLILFILFQGKDLGATTQQVMLEDEKGNTIHRTIPKNEFVKNVAVFYFENSTDDENLVWLSFGISELLRTDFEQDIFINTGFLESFNEEIKQAAIQKGDHVPTGLMRDIAKNFRMDYFLSGSYDLTEKGYLLHTQLFKTGNGSQVSEHTLEGADIFALAEKLAVKIKGDLQIPSKNIEKLGHLPLSGLLTSHIESYKKYIKGCELVIENNFDGSIPYFLESIDMDSDFLIANLNLAVSYYFNEQLGEAFVYIDKVMDKIYLLPERLRYEAKYWYYRMHSEHEEMILVQELLVSLYPNDIKAIWLLAMNYQSVGAYDKAEQLIKSALEFDDNRGEFYVSLAKGSFAQDKKEEALIYYQMYAQKYPDHTRSFQLLGDYYFYNGDFEKAEQNYKKSLILSVDNNNSQRKLILIKERQGLFKEAEYDLNSALEHANTITDSLDIFLYQMNYQLLRGQINKAIQIREEWISTAENVYSPTHISRMSLQNLYPYYLLNQSDRALRFIYKEEIYTDSLKTEMSLSQAYLEYFIHNEDIQRAEVELGKVEPYLATFGLSENLANLKGDIFFVKGEFEKAMETYQQFKGDLSGKEKFDAKIVLCLINLDRISEAKEQLNEILNLNPYHAEAHLQIARILLDQHKNKEAKEHLLIAHQVWENADEAFLYAQETESLLAELDH